MQLKTIPIFILLVALALAGCDSPTETPVPTEASEEAGITQIVLLKESVGLDGMTPIYTLTLDAEAGAFTLEEKDADPVEGEVSAEQIEALAATVDEIGFFDFDEDYIPPDGSCCDLVYYTITVTRGDESHSVRGSDSEHPKEGGFLELMGEIEAVTK